MATLLAEITNAGRRAMADMATIGRCFQVVSFVTGNGGHDPGNSDIALTPDVSVLELPGLSFGPKNITVASSPTPFSAEFICDLAKSEAIGQLSNIGILAVYTDSPIPSDPLVGTTFLYAIANMPLQNKLAGETRQFTVTINY